MKAMYRPVATNGMVDEGFFFGSLPKFDAANTDYSVKLLASVYLEVSFKCMLKSPFHFTRLLQQPVSTV